MSLVYHARDALEAAERHERDCTFQLKKAKERVKARKEALLDAIDNERNGVQALPLGEPDDSRPRRGSH